MSDSTGTPNGDPKSMKTTEARRTCILVLGMHRSGTSALTRVLNLLGAALPKNIMGVGVGNELGHWEPLNLVTLHDQMLAEAGSSWDDWRELDLAVQLGDNRYEHYKTEIRRLIDQEYGDESLFVIKEPRICRFVPLYREILHEMGITVAPILVFRNPLSISASLKARNGMPDPLALACWLRYVLDAERNTRDLPRIVLSYEALLADWRNAILPIRQAFDVDWPELSIEIVNEIDAFLSVDHQHFTASFDALEADDTISSWISRAYTALTEWASNHATAEADFSAVTDEFEPGAKYFSHVFAAERKRFELVMAALNARTEADEDGAQKDNDASIDKLVEICTETSERLQVARSQVETLESEVARLSRIASDNLSKAEVLSSNVSLLSAELERRERYIDSLETIRYSPGALLGMHIEEVGRKLFPRGSRRRRTALALVKPVLRNLQNSRLEKIASRDDSSEAVRNEAGNVSEGPLAQPYQYEQWIRAIEPYLCGSLRKTAENGYQPLISVIVPVYKVSEDTLKQTIESVANQSYTNWQLCLAYADIENSRNWNLIEQYAARDSRIVALHLDENLGISANSNACLEQAKGEFVALLDHDDTIPERALETVVDLLNKDPELDFIYTDKDCISENGNLRLNPLFKPEWSPEMLYSVNYLTHFNVIRTELVREIGGFRPETDGAQDWDLFLRVTDRTSRIRRLTGVYYHWRILPSSTSTGIEAKPWAHAGQLRSLKDHVARKGLDAEVLEHAETGFRLAWKRNDVRYRILVDGSASAENLLNCIQRLVELTDVPITVFATEADLSAFRSLCRHYDLKPASHVEIFASNNPHQALLERLCDGGEWESSVIVSGSLLNFTPTCLSDLAAWAACHPEIGFASAVIVDGGDNVIEAGALKTGGGIPLPLFRDEPLYKWGIFGGPLWHRNIRTVSPYLVAFKQSVLNGMEHATGLDLIRSIDRLCDKSLISGLRGVTVPSARAILANGCGLPLPAFDDTAARDPYFSPEFQSANPILLRSTLLERTSE